MDSIVIINRSPQADDLRFLNEEKAVHIPCWKTCLRQVYFTTYNELTKLKMTDSDQVFHKEEASLYLISILCGMESPVFGETEVFGQFKNFLQTVEKSNSYFSTHSKWLKFILETVKFIRTQYIQGLGSNSYGSTLRKLTKDDLDITIVGAGNLTHEVLPWLAKSKNIEILVRQPRSDKYQNIIENFPEIQIKPLSNVERILSTLIIAAPIENSQILDLIKTSQNSVKIIYDLRSSGFDNLNQVKDIKIVSLHDFFQMINVDRHRFNLIKIDLQNLIRVKCQNFANRIEVRPLGWEDLCI